MWAIVKDGSVQQVFNNPRSVTIDGVLHPPGIFGTGWTNAERKAIGIYNYVEVNTRYDNRFYTLGSRRQSINNGTGTVTVTYTNAAKNLAAAKTEMIGVAKQQVDGRLSSTDWQVIAKAERSRAIDSDVATYRAAVITAYGQIKTLINAQDTIAKLAALYTTPLDSDGNQRKDSDGELIYKYDIDKWPDRL